MITFKQFLDLVDRTYHEHSFDWRYGQTLMNVLHGIAPKQYRDITRTDYDCYYNDGTVRFTLDKLEKEWPNNDLPSGFDPEWNIPDSESDVTKLGLR